MKVFRGSGVQGFRGLAAAGLLTVLTLGAAAAPAPAPAEEARRVSPHWSFQPLGGPAVPGKSKVKTPRGHPKAKEGAAWGRNPIDAFVLEAARKKGLRPAPPADARTLIRRLSFDVTGLPPTPEEVDAFVRECEAERKGGKGEREKGSGPDRARARARARSGAGASVESARGVGDPSLGGASSRTQGGEGLDSSRTIPYPLYPVPSASSAYERLVDRLLASPRYGERWARHWLDVARYADSNGQEGDQDRPTAYHYRDFVIWALNEDLPYDTFVRWQLAGDEIEPDNPRAVAATGFVTAGPHTVLDVPMEEEKIRNRLNELDDQLATTGSAFLGLTVGCARCHDHMYDPIPTRDYYRMLAAFNAGDRAEIPLVPHAEGAKWRAADQAWKRDLAAARKELEEWLPEQKRPFTARLREARVDALPLDPAGKALLKGPPADPRARELAQQYSRQLKIEDAEYRALFSEEQRRRWDALEAALRAVEARKPAPLPTALAMADFGPTPRETWLLERGDLARKKERVELGFLSALTRGKSAQEYRAQARAAGQRADTTYQRRAMAEWLTDTEQGAGALLARVIVNRLWQHHFGEGLVRTVNDFGVQGERPTHPELLDYLATVFVSGDGLAGEYGSVGVGKYGGGRTGTAASHPHTPTPPHSYTPTAWSLKSLHRLILTSAAYRQRRAPRRLEAEAFRDAMLCVSGTLTERLYGPAVKPPILPEAIQARNVKDPYPKELEDTPETRRRSVYLFHKRVVQYPLLQAFDAPDAAASCGRRNATTVAPQALAVLNDPFVRLRAGEFARRLRAEAGEASAAQVERAYRLALGRASTATERATSLRFLEQQAARRAGRESTADAGLLALTDFAQAVFGLNEFSYVD